MRKLLLTAILVLGVAGIAVAARPAASALAATGGSGTVKTHDTCGGGSQAVDISVDIGCTGKGEPVIDMAFALIRFLSYGVGLVIIGSIVYGGLQYIGSRGDPGSTAAAISRIQNSVIALLIFLFAFAIINYVVPKGFIFR